MTRGTFLNPGIVDVVVLLAALALFFIFIVLPSVTSTDPLCATTTPTGRPKTCPLSVGESGHEILVFRV